MATRTVTASEGIDLLTALGVDVAVQDAETVTLALEGRSVIARVRVRRSAPSQWDIRRDAESDRARDARSDLVLYVVPRATVALTETASADERIAVASVHDGVVILRRKTIHVPGGTRAAAQDQAEPTRGRVAWGRFALMRALLRTPRPRIQIELANECGVSQVTVSNGLRALDAWVVRDEAGWRALRPEKLWEHFLAEYPGPQGITTYWLGLDAVGMQARKVRDAAAEFDGLMSGDTAADEIAPWRIDRRAVIYARTGLNLASLGFSETNRANATLEYVVPADRTIWSTARAWTRGAPVWMADPVLAAWDVRRTGGPDAEEAVERIERTVLAGWLR